VDVRLARGIETGGELQGVRPIKGID